MPDIVMALKSRYMLTCTFYCTGRAEIESRKTTPGQMNAINSKSNDLMTFSCKDVYFNPRQGKIFYILFTIGDLYSHRDDPTKI